jgi:hypothetical protein
MSFGAAPAMGYLQVAGRGAVKPMRSSDETTYAFVLAGLVMAACSPRAANTDRLGEPGGGSDSSLAHAKTDRAVDPGSGTGGITVLDVTSTTDYDYQAPIVTAINGGPPVLSTDAAAGGRSYDFGTRKLANMPPGWFTCRTVDDCDLVPVLCGPSFAVAKAHKAEARAAECAAIPTCGPKASCIQPVPDTSKAVCDHGECRTIF